MRGPSVLPAEQWVALSVIALLCLSMVVMVCWACYNKVREGLAHAIEEQRMQDEVAYAKGQHASEKGGTPPMSLSLGVTPLVDSELRAIAKSEVASRLNARESNVDLGEAMTLARKVHRQEIDAHKTESFEACLARELAEFDMHTDYRDRKEDHLHHGPAPHVLISAEQVHNVSTLLDTARHHHDSLQDAAPEPQAPAEAEMVHGRAFIEDDDGNANQWSRKLVN